MGNSQRFMKEEKTDYMTSMAPQENGAKTYDSMNQPKDYKAQRLEKFENKFLVNADKKIALISGDEKRELYAFLSDSIDQARRIERNRIETVAHFDVGKDFARDLEEALIAIDNQDGK